MKNINKPSQEGKDKNRYITIILICIIVILLTVIICLVCKGTHPKLSDGKQIVASIDGKEFTAEDLYTELNKQGGYNVLTTLVDDFIINKEIENKDDAKKYAESIIAQYEEQYKNSSISFKDLLTSNGYESVDAFKEVVMNSYLREQVAKKYIKESITDEELKNYYEKHVSDELSVKHILIKPDVADNATSDEKKKAEGAALDQAKEIIKKLDNGEDFEKLAKEFSKDTGSASNGGVINNVVKDKYITEFWDAANKLEVGKYTTEPVKSKFGYHIIYKVSHTPKKSFEEMKDSLYDNVVSAKISDDKNLTEKTWVEIHKKYNLSIVDTDIQRVYDANVKSLNSAK